MVHCSGYSCFFFGTNFYLTWYPTYLREYLHMSHRALGIWGSVPLFAGMVGDIVGGSLSDMIFKPPETRVSRGASSLRRDFCWLRCSLFRPR